MATLSKQGKSKPKASKRSKPLSNAALLKLAAKRRPPQAWYDEQTDPFQAKAKAK